MIDVAASAVYKAYKAQGPDTDVLTASQSGLEQWHK